jgi:hypothetical protein
VRNHAHPHARNVAAYGEGAIVGDRSFGKCQMHRAMNILVSSATVHLKKIAVKSQDLGKQISRKRVAQQILRQRNKRFAFAVCGVLLAFPPAQL